MRWQRREPNKGHRRRQHIGHPHVVDRVQRRTNNTGIDFKLNRLTIGNNVNGSLGVDLRNRQLGLDDVHNIGVSRQGAKVAELLTGGGIKVILEVTVPSVEGIGTVILEREVAPTVWN